MATMRYFCRCFICESEDVCSHREHELLVWWLAQSREMPIAAAKPIPPSNCAALTDREVPGNAPKAVLVRKPFVRAEALRRSGYNLAVSREDALAQRRV